MGTLSRGAVALLVACGTLGPLAACSDLLGITAFTGAAEEAGAPPATDGSSSSGSTSSSTSGSGSGGMVDGSSSSGSGSGSGNEAGPEGGSGSSGGSDGGSSSGSDGGGMPVILFRGYTTASDSGVNGIQVLLPALDWPQSTGDLIVLLINYDVALSLTGVSDSSGNTYTRFGSPATDTDYHEAMYYCLSAKAAAAGANTVTVEQSASGMVGDFSVNVFGFSAPGRTWVQDQYTNNSQMNVTAVTTGAVTTTYADEVLVAGTGVNSDVVAGSGGSWIAEPKDGLGDLQEFSIVDSLQTDVTATFTQKMASVAVSQLGTFAAKP